MRNISVPTVIHQRFTVMREDYAADLGLPKLSNADMFIAIFKYAERSPDEVREVLRGLAKSSQT